MKKSNNKTQTLIEAYQKLQSKPWGNSTIVEGYYFIGNIELTEAPNSHRQQALAMTYWKERIEDEFNTEVTFPITLGALYNKRSTKSNIKMNDLLGQTIHIKKVRYFQQESKSVFAIDWHIVIDPTEEELLIIDEQIAEMAQDSEVFIDDPDEDLGV